MLSLKRMNLRRKLFLLVGISVLGLVVLGLASYMTFTRIKVGGPIANEIDRDLRLAGDILPPPLNILQTRIVVYQILRETDRSKLQAEITHLQELKGAYLEAHDNWEKILPDGRIKDLVIVRAHEPAMAYYQLAEHDLIPAALRGDKKRAESFVPRLIAIYALHDAAMEDASKLYNEEIAAAERRAQATVTSSISTLIVVTLIAGMLITILGLATARGILGPIGKTMHILQALAEGDLRNYIEVDSTDEIGAMGHALNKAIEGMANTIQSIAATAEHVASASEEISSSATQQGARRGNPEGSDRANRHCHARDVVYRDASFRQFQQSRRRCA